MRSSILALLLVAGGAAHAATVGEPLRAYTQSMGDPLPLSDPDAYMPERPFYRLSSNGPEFLPTSYGYHRDSFDVPFRFRDAPLTLFGSPFRHLGINLGSRSR